MIFEAGFRSVVFDCDSTLAAIEGIDELASEHREEVQALTDRAMDGQVPLEAVYGLRLEMIRPSRERVEALGRAYVAALVEDARPTVAALRWLGKDVRIVSGGLRPPVEALARELALGPECVRAVGIRFAAGGEYEGWEADSFLARSGGKPRVIGDWKLPRPALLVGDGVTDLEARPAVDAFAAYTGVVRRDAVVRGADIVIAGPSLAPILALAADPVDRRRLQGSPWADLLQRGDLLLDGAAHTPNHSR